MKYDMSHAEEITVRNEIDQRLHIADEVTTPEFRIAMMDDATDMARDYFKSQDEEWQASAEGKTWWAFYEKAKEASFPADVRAEFAAL